MVVEVVPYRKRMFWIDLIDLIGVGELVSPPMKTPFVTRTQIISVETI
jgi:hypothetical protein